VIGREYVELEVNGRNELADALKRTVSLREVK
jgi:hypothetical protein